MAFPNKIILLSYHFHHPLDTSLYPSTHTLITFLSAFMNYVFYYPSLFSQHPLPPTYTLIDTPIVRVDINTS